MKSERSLNRVLTFGDPFDPALKIVDDSEANRSLMWTMKRLWIVSPVYFDVESYLLLRSHILDVLQKAQIASSVRVNFVAVDDSGGLDSEFSRLRALSDVRVIEPPFNLGHQRALVFALRTLRDEIDDDDYIVTLDADGEDQPSDLPRLLKPLLEEPSALRRIALAMRTKRSESFSFKVLYLFFRILFRSLVGSVIRTGNFAAYRGWLARRILFHPHFDLCYSSSFISLKLRVKWVPAERGRRLLGTSKMSYSRLLMHGVQMLLPFTDRIAIRLLIGFSVLFGLSSLVLLSGSILPLVSATVIPSWTMILALMMSLLSFTALGNLIILFAAFSYSRGTSLKNLEGEHCEQSGISSPPTD